MALGVTEELTIAVRGDPGALYAVLPCDKGAKRFLGGGAVPLPRRAKMFSPKGHFSINKIYPRFSKASVEQQSFFCNVTDKSVD
jgi:hypothetical protein